MFVIIGKITELVYRKILKKHAYRIRTLVLSLLIELRRVVSLFLLPWMSILVICLVVSWHSLYVAGFDVLLAPILKFWLFLKPLLLKTIPALLLWIWVHTGAKLISWIGEIALLLGTLLGGWKAWSAKKLMRHIGRFFLSLSARFVFVSVLLNLLFGHERRGLKSLPWFVVSRLHSSPVGSALRWWSGSSERRKRLLLGAGLCVILVMAGQSMLGVSVLLFDLLWELLLIVWYAITKLGRLLSPYVLKLIPNFIGNFVTHTLLPLFADVVPVIRDDHRVIYLRLNVRLHIRRAKAWLYLKSRARRNAVRKRITPFVGDNLRAKKASLLSASAKLGSRTDKKEGSR